MPDTSNKNPLLGFIITMPADCWDTLCTSGIKGLLTELLDLVSPCEAVTSLREWLSQLEMTVKRDVQTDPFWEHYADHPDGTRVALLARKGERRNTSLTIELPEEITPGHLLALLVPKDTNITIRPVNMTGFWRSHEFHPGGTITLKEYLSIFQ